MMTAGKGLVYGNLVYQVEKPKSEIEVAFLCLLSLFIKSITGLLFGTTHIVLKPVKNLDLSLSVCIFLKH